MLERLEKRAAQWGERMAAARRRDLAAKIENGVPGVRAAVEGERVVLGGRGLRRRRLSDPALRWLGRWMR